ncbi:MAG: hypothetical protein ABUL58_04375 [Steroidobacter sp.]
MSHRDDLHDDHAIEEYLKRGADLSQRYKESSQDDVPPEMDKNVLMQARNAVSDKKVVTHPSWWIKWNKPLGLAATLMLAFTVIYRVGYRSIDRLSEPEPRVLAKQATTTTGQVSEALKPADTEGEEKQVAAKELKAVRPQKDHEQDKFEALAKAQSSRSLPEVTQPPASLPSVQITLPAPAAAPSIAPAPTVNEPAPIAANAGAVSGNTAKPREADAVVDSVTAEDVGQFPDRSVAELMNRIPGVELKREEPVPLKNKLDKTNPEQVLQYIRDLRKQGRKKKAEKAWKQFQKDFPDYFVAKDDVVRGDVK